MAGFSCRFGIKRAILALPRFYLSAASVSVDTLLFIVTKICYTEQHREQQEEVVNKAEETPEAGAAVEEQSLLGQHSLLFEVLSMEQQATHLLAVLKNSNVTVDTKIDLLTKLKTQIKHQQVPEVAITPVFEVVRTAISNAHLLDAGFSILFHLTKRLELQDQSSIIAAEGKKTYSYILERLGDAKDRTRSWAIQALTEFWKASHTDVEQIIRDMALSGRSPRAKEAAMQWVVKTRENSLQIKAFVPKILDCLGDQEGSVRDTAKSTIIELFRNLNDGAKNDLKKQVLQRDIQKSIITHIFTQLGIAETSDFAPTTSSYAQGRITPANEKLFGNSVSSVSAPSTSSLPTVVPSKEKPFSDNAIGIESTTRDRNASGTLTSASAPSIPAISASEMEAKKLDAIVVYSNRELEELFRDIHPHFEGKETEFNWNPREDNIIKLRRITKGNAPKDYTTTYLVSIKGLLDGILKAVTSLRTTVSSNGCHLVQDIARTCGPGLDSMVEIILQPLLKLCGATKTIAAETANKTIDTIFAYVTYNMRILQHIWSACQDKNVRPRSFATVWLKTIIDKHGHHRNTLEHANGLDLIEKCIRHGLADANPEVRESTRATYWSYWGFWPDRSEVILNSLDAKQQARLLKDPSNPQLAQMNKDSSNLDPKRTMAASTSSNDANIPVLSRVTKAVTTRPSLKETIAAQKRAKLAQRPGSAQASVSPTRAMPPRPQTSMAMGSLSSAPLRPNKTKLPAPKANSPSTSPKKAKNKPPLPDFGALHLERRDTSPLKSNLHRNENDIPAKPSLLKTPSKRSSFESIKSPAKRLSFESITQRTESDVPRKQSPFKVLSNKASSESLKSPAKRLSFESLVQRNGNNTVKKGSPVKAPAKKSSIESITNRGGNMATTKHSVVKPISITNKTIAPAKQSLANPMIHQDEDIEPMAQSLSEPEMHNEYISDHNEANTGRPISNGNTVVRPSTNIAITESDDNMSAKPSQMHTSPAIGLHKQMQKSSESILQRVHSESRHLKNFDEEHQQPQSSPSKAAEEFTLVLPNITTVDSPTGPMSLSMTLGPNGFETGRSILGELPLNHEGTVRRASSFANSGESRVTQDAGSRNSTAETMIRKHITTPINTFSQISRTPSSEQKLIDSGITRVQAMTLDAHGYRKLQSLITTRTDRWQFYQYDDLFRALLKNIKAPVDLRSTASVLKTIRLMLASQPAMAQAILSHAVLTFLVVRPKFRDHTHLADELEDISRDMVMMLEDPLDLILSIILILETTEDHGLLTVAMSLESLGDILHRGVLLTEDQQLRLGSALQGLMANAHTGVRQSAMECLVELHQMSASHEAFWACMGNAAPADKNLLAYFLASRGVAL
ncbi:suppressor of tub2 mutation [Xylographa trunciseda]|nr:suppressor of tub2 mutation [Xylographa trunciseda]